MRLKEMAGMSVKFSRPDVSYTASRCPQSSLKAQARAGMTAEYPQ